jgi:hypothetical protein
MTDAAKDTNADNNNKEELDRQDPETESDTSSGGAPEEPDVANPQKGGGS